MNVWFIGDIHGGHKNICNFRKQFASEEEHFNYVKERYHSCVTKRDTVFFMGDIAFTMDRLKDISSWTAHQNVVIAGNHDTDKIPMKELVLHFDKVYGLLKYKCFWLSHCPLHPAELRGKFNIHGHTHYHNIKGEDGQDDPRYFNTSLENIDFRPISLLQIRKHFNLE